MTTPQEASLEEEAALLPGRRPQVVIMSVPHKRHQDGMLLGSQSVDLNQKSRGVRMTQKRPVVSRFPSARWIAPIRKTHQWIRQRQQTACEERRVVLVPNRCHLLGGLFPPTAAHIRGSELFPQPGGLWLRVVSDVASEQSHRSLSRLSLA